MEKKQVQKLQELYDNAIDNAKILKNNKSKLQILLIKEDITNLSIMTPQTMSNSAKIFNNLSTANNILITANQNKKILNKVLPLLQVAQELIMKG